MGKESYVLDQSLKLLMKSKLIAARILMKSAKVSKEIRLISHNFQEPLRKPEFPLL